MLLSEAVIQFYTFLGPQNALHPDPKLFADDVDIRFSRTANSCKLPQVRYATPDRLLQRLTGLKKSKTIQLSLYYSIVHFLFHKIFDSCQSIS